MSGSITKADLGRFSSPAPSRWRTFAVAATLSGLVSAAAEMAVVLPVQWSFGTPPGTLFQSIAYGALGDVAFREGASSVGLGLFVHVLISLVCAGLYTEAALRSPALLRRPILGGLAYGLAVFFVMVFVVIPLSRIGFHPPKKPGLMAISVGTHMVAFGLPIALVSTGWIRLSRARATSPDAPV